MNKVLIPDPARCIACRACEAACSTAKEGESNLTKSRIKMILFHEEYFYYPLVCLQCETPYCALPCPTGALRKNLDSGVVELVKERCVGCKMCLIACPFGAITMVGGLPSKCDLCDGDPTCVKFCEAKALSYGEPEGMSIDKRIAFAQRMKEAYQGFQSSAEA